MIPRSLHFVLNQKFISHQSVPMCIRNSSKANISSRTKESNRGNLQRIISSQDNPIYHDAGIIQNVLKSQGKLKIQAQKHNNSNRKNHQRITISMTII